MLEAGSSNELGGVQEPLGNRGAVCFEKRLAIVAEPADEHKRQNIPSDRRTMCKNLHKPVNKVVVCLDGGQDVVEHREWIAHSEACEDAPHHTQIFLRQASGTFLCFSHCAEAGEGAERVACVDGAEGLIEHVALDEGETAENTPTLTGERVVGLSEHERREEGAAEEGEDDFLLELGEV